MSYKLKISNYADADLKNVYLDGLSQWGEAQADNYFNKLIEHFDLLCANPFMFVAVDEIRIGYRRSVCGSHSIYYRINQETVEVMGVLKRQNPLNYLP